MGMEFKISSINPEKKGWRKCLGDLEAEIMEIIWKKKSVSVQEVLEELSHRKSLAYTTVMTVMDRLSKKGLLHRERRGKKYIYHPALSEMELEEKLFSSLYSSFLRDWGKPALAHFVDSVSKEDLKALDELEKLIEAKRKNYEKRTS
jgi:predicted transcriptional regulator